MNTGAAIALLVGASVVFVAGLTWMMIWLNNSYSRQEKAALGRLHAELPRRGWRFSERDDSVAELYTSQMREYGAPGPMRPFAGTPKGKKARNVVTGIHRGRPFLAASVYTTYANRQGWTRWIWVRTPAAGPGLTVRKAMSIGSAINNAIYGEIKVGNPEIDRQFDILGNDARFAGAVMSPALAEFLLRDPRQWRELYFFADHLEVLDRSFDHRDPAELIPALDLRCDILDRIPAAAWAWNQAQN